MAFVKIFTHFNHLNAPFIWGRGTIFESKEKQNFVIFWKILKKKEFLRINNRVFNEFFNQMVTITSIKVLIFPILRSKESVDNFINLLKREFISLICVEM